MTPFIKIDYGNIRRIKNTYKKLQEESNNLYSKIKTLERSGHYACVSLLDGSKLYSLYTVKDFVKLLGLKKEDEP